jgi:uncharacterized protein YaaN involved in tellurite resistance
MSTRSARAGATRDDIAFASNALNAWMELPRRQYAMVLAMQADAMRFGMQQATRFWSEAANMALKMQADMLSRASEQIIERATEPTLESFQRAFEATLNGRGAAATTH